MADYQETLEPGVETDPNYNRPAAFQRRDEPAVEVPSSPLEKYLEGQPEREREFSKRIDELTKSVTESIERERAERDKQTEEQKPIQEQYLKAAGEKLPPLPSQQELPAPPNPKRLAQEAQESTATWMTALVPFALVAGGLSKGGAYAASTAMTGLMNGIGEGNQDKIDREYKNWKAATDYAVAQNKQEVDEYNRILKNRQLNLDQMANELQLVAAKHQDAITAEAANRRNLVELGKIVESKDKSGAQFAAAAARIEAIKAQADAIKARKELSGAYSDEAIKNMVRQFFENGQEPKISGRAQDVAALRHQFVEMRAQIMAKEGITWQQLREKWNRNAAERRANVEVGSRAGKFLIAEKEYQALVPPLRDAIAAVDRGEFSDLNQLYRIVQTRTGSEEERRLSLAVNTLANVYTRTMIPSGQGAQADRRHALSLIEEQMSKNQIAAVLDQMEIEQKATEQSIPDSLRDIPRLFQRKGETPAAPKIPERPATVPPGSAYSPSRMMWRGPDGTLYKADGTKAD